MRRKLIDRRFRCDLKATYKRLAIDGCDLIEQKSCLVPYGKHFMRYLGPYLWSRISATDKKRLMLDSFRNKDLTVLIDDACANCNIITA